jgi:hypothetical protein
MPFADAEAAGFVRGAESATTGCASYGLYRGGVRNRASRT